MIHELWRIQTILMLKKSKISSMTDLRTTVSFVTAHLEIFHCKHDPVMPKSDSYFTFCSTLNALSKRTSKQLLMDYLTALGNVMIPSTPLNECEINVSVNFKPNHPPPPGNCRGFAHSSCPWDRVFAPLSCPEVLNQSKS